MLHASFQCGKAFAFCYRLKFLVFFVGKHFHLLKVFPNAHWQTVTIAAGLLMTTNCQYHYHCFLLIVVIFASPLEFFSHTHQRQNIVTNSFCFFTMSRSIFQPNATTVDYCQLIFNHALSYLISFWTCIATTMKQWFHSMRQQFHLGTFHLASKLKLFLLLSFLHLFNDKILLCVCIQFNYIFALKMSKWELQWHFWGYQLCWQNDSSRTIFLKIFKACSSSAWKFQHQKASNLKLKWWEVKFSNSLQTLKFEILLNFILNLKYFQKRMELQCMDFKWSADNTAFKNFDSFAAI